MNKHLSRRKALNGMMGAAATPFIANTPSGQRGIADSLETKRIFVDLNLAEAEAATVKGQIFQLVDSISGKSVVYRRTAAGSERLYEEVTATALREPDGSSGIGFDNDTVKTRLNILSATMRPAMRGIFSSDSDQRVALLDFVTEAATEGKVIEWGPIDLTLDVVTPASTIRGLGVPSGSRWVFHPDMRLRAMPNSSDSYCILNILDASNIVIEGCGARLIGDRRKHTDTGGQVGNGLGCGIRGGANITIRDLIAEECWGDGFYVGSSTKLTHSQDILLDNVRGANNARQGLSVISARNMICRDSHFSGTEGLLPESGVDIEPNYNYEYLEAVRFQNVRTSGNRGAGFLVFLSAMDGTTNPVDVTVEGLNDDGSTVGIQLGFAGTRGIPGCIRFLNPRLANTAASAISALNYQSSAAKIVIDDPLMIDWNRSGGTSNKYHSAISLYAEKDSVGTTALGNIEINRPRYMLNSGTTPYLFNVSDERAAADPAIAIRHIDPLEAPPEKASFMNAGLTNSCITQRDSFGTITHALPDANVSITGTGYFSRYTIPALTSERSYSVNNNQPIGWEFEFVVIGVGRGQGRIAFNSGPVLLPLHNSAGGFYIYSMTDGSRIRIRKTAAKRWEVVEQIGTWTIMS